MKKLIGKIKIKIMPFHRDLIVLWYRSLGVKIGERVYQPQCQNRHNLP